MEEPRIGVYVCWCGGNISDVVNVKKVVEEIRKEPGVVVANDFMFMCSDAGQKMIENDIKNYKLNAVVVASCSPKLHEQTFRNTVVRAGLNPYMYYHANIREHVSCPHGDEPEEATKKAIRHVRTAVAYLRHAKPLERIKVDATSSVLIVGGGIAGLTAALDLAKIGTTVYLVEKSPFLGGNVSRIGSIYPYGRKGSETVAELITELLKYENVAVYTNAEVKSIKGYIGNYEVELKIKPRYFKGKCENIEDAIKACPMRTADEMSFGLEKRTAIMVPPHRGAYPNIPAIDDKLCNRCGECLKVCKDKIDFNQEYQTVVLKVGSIIISTGFKPYEPKEGEYGYAIYNEVLTLPQLSVLLEKAGGSKELKVNGKRVETIAYIYCVGSRQKPGNGEKANTYCSRYCCNATMHLAIKIAEKYPGIKQYHFYRDIRTYGKNELMYEEACKKGSVFIKYSEDEPPKVRKDKCKIIVETKDLLTDGLEIEVPADLVVLVTGMEPNSISELNEVLKLPMGRDGFFQEVHPKLRPVETTLAGMFIAGTAQGPKDIKETVASALAAAAKAASIALKKSLELEPFIAYVEPEKCNLSKNCIAECPFGAISIKSYETVGERAWVNPALCKGCGACVAVCPTEAIQIQGLTNRQIEEMIKTAGREV
ncbi:MAG: CoB--CoM heterodisulfide reductase iron-sulfur subunit A family protein [Fervidicoccaceae archaeon]|jgi:heterodisulfide reductase subunit A